MIEKESKIENARFVEGDLGVHFVYTAGVAGEEFLRALAKGKLLASTCEKCSKTYCPPRIFCEDCFHEVRDRHEVEPTGTIDAVTRIEIDEGGATRAPETVAAIRLDGTDTTILHRLEGDEAAIGSRVEAVWATKRTGSILDVKHFRVLSGAKAQPRATVRVASARANGRSKTARRATA